jgi:excinuclease ABC subunit C
MLPPLTAFPADLDSIPDRPAVFLLWAGEGTPYLARTGLLRRRLRRILSDRGGADAGRLSRVLNLRGLIQRIEYWPTGSRLESSLIHLELAQRYYPEHWPRLTRLHPPFFVRLLLENTFPRMLITSRSDLGKDRGLFYGPFPSRAAAERFETGVLDLFQLRRCEENLQPSPQHPGCIYGEMNRCLRPCQQAVSVDEYRTEAVRVEQFLRTGGKSLLETAESARDRASTEMQFEEASRLHQRVQRIEEVETLSGDVPRELSHLHGVAVVPSAEFGSVDLWVLAGGRWLEPKPLSVGTAGQSMDHQIKELLAGAAPSGPPHPEHLAIFMRWYESTWRDGEWIGFDSFDKIPYRKLVNAAARVSGSAGLQAGPLV